MDTAKVKVDREGRILIPAKLRRAIGVTYGDELVVRLVDDCLELTTKTAQPRRAKRLLQTALEQ